MCKICFDTTVFQNYKKHRKLLENFFRHINSKNFAYQGESHKIHEEFHPRLTFVSENNISLELFLQIREKHSNLHDGEICLITFALENNCCFISDDEDARKRAKGENIHPCCINNENVEIGGSIGILIFLRDIAKIISKEEAKKIYEEMQKHNWLPNMDIDKINLEECI